MLDGAARLDDLFAEAARMGMPALAMTDHGNVFGAYDFWKKATQAGVKPIIGVEAYVTPRHPPHATAPGSSWATAARDDVSGGGRLHPHDAAGREHRGHAQPVPACPRLASLEGYFYKPRMDRELLADLRRGPDRHHRLPVRRGADPAAARQVRRGASRPPRSSATSSAPRTSTAS